MSQDLKDLYRKVVLDHNRSPRNFGALERTTHRAEGSNPLCGDRVELFLEIMEEKVQEIGFSGEGCAICTASASLLTEAIKGKTKQEVGQLQELFHQLLSGTINVEKEGDVLGELVVFGGVAQYPTRIKCATLAWQTLLAALEHSQDTVSTE